MKTRGTCGKCSFSKLFDSGEALWVDVVIICRPQTFAQLTYGRMYRY